MNKDDILNMPAGREMDALIAYEVWGLVSYKSDGNFDFTNERDYLDVGEPYYLGEHQEIIRLPKYSTDIAAAWEVVEKITEKGLGFSISDYSPAKGWHAEFYGKQTEEQADAETTPLAICRAALLAVMDNNNA